MSTTTIKRPAGTRFVVQNLITLTIDVNDGQLEVQAEAPEGVEIKNHEFDGYTSIDTAQPRYSLTVTYPGRESRHSETSFIGGLLGDVIQELEENPGATITIKTSVSE